MQKFKITYVIVFLLLAVFGSQTLAANIELEPGQVEKAKQWVAELNSEDQEKSEKVVNIIATHLTFIRKWHNEHPYTMVPAGINPRTGDKLTKLDRQIIMDSSMPDSIHNNLMNGLRELLSEEQVEFILDKYTVGKVGFTMPVYKQIVPDMTSEEEIRILGYLKEAREMAVDYKSMKEISAIFEIYKTKCEQHLIRNGRNWRALYKAFVKSSHEKKK